MDMMLWNIVLSALLAVVGWFLKGAIDAAKDTKDQLNAFKVDVAHQYTHKNDLRDIMVSINERFDRIEKKIDRLMEVK
jgi:basic membrane lipoprotein Med (substrate-binding protein (PBP1-ABC) superfamily)